jgi:hypothetical protein
LGDYVRRLLRRPTLEASLLLAMTGEEDPIAFFSLLLAMTEEEDPIAFFSLLLAMTEEEDPYFPHCSSQ